MLIIRKNSITFAGNIKSDRVTLHFFSKSN